MIRSMTGYGQAQEKIDGYDIAIEIKSVNHRFIDINTRISRKYMVLEEKIKEFIKKFADRGRFDLNIQINIDQEVPKTIKVDKELAMAYYNSLKDLADFLSISANFKVIDFIRLPDILQLENKEENFDTLWKGMEKVLAKALESLMKMRIDEGLNLYADLIKRNDFILQKIDELELRSPQVVFSYRERLEKRIKELLEQNQIDNDRIIQETAIFADKICINEEIVRLRSHVNQFSKLLNAENAVGRKCDFLVQEMYREINTIASKANDSEISFIVVDVKAELEKIREQIQNIE